MNSQALRKRLQKFEFIGRATNYSRAVIYGRLLLTFLCSSASLNGTADPICDELVQSYYIAGILKQALGIGAGFDTRLRVEKKSTNSEADANKFLQHIQTTIDHAVGETFSLRDRPKPDMVLVTSTTYPFSRRLQNLLAARIRVREYRERPMGGTGRFASTTQGFVNLEVKAKTEHPGVVVKPILKLPKDTLPLLFKDLKHFQENRPKISQTLLSHNEGMADVISDVLDVVETFHFKAGHLNIPMEAVNIEYERQAFALKVQNRNTLKDHNVQITFDRLVTLRDNVDPQKSPWEIAIEPPTHAYPTTPGQAVVVIEMKSDLEIDRQFREQPALIEESIPSYWRIRRWYETLQDQQAEGFEADSGKAAQIKAFKVD